VGRPGRRRRRPPPSQPPPPPRSRPRRTDLMTSPLTADEIAAVRMPSRAAAPPPAPPPPTGTATGPMPYRAASLLPGRAYHDPAIHEFERKEWFRRDWIVVGREEDAPSAGTSCTPGGARAPPR